ncbi:pentapeptide repeat-containing protein [Flavobacterium sp. I3-2]|uniref:pentapeptide repeat-containing protein n=1 Tax=Flavobacterium sp. I3-2 TaxID=2748319 RepID=UPI0015AEC2E4|nr:pentapeptide repeat-containing protein [Flavobacterium sp. I3-2]
MENIYNQKFECFVGLSIAEYESCIFESGDFTKHNLIGFVFIDCVFLNSNFNMVEVGNTSFKQVKFIDCKMLGVRFDTCNPFLFEAIFENCYLNLASFYKMKIRKAVFKNCNLVETDFTEAHLMESDFSESNLFRAIFKQTNLVKANFNSAKDYTIDPDNNDIKKAKFSIPGVFGLLDKYNIVIK